VGAVGHWNILSSIAIMARVSDAQRSALCLEKHKRWSSLLRNYCVFSAGPAGFKGRQSLGGLRTGPGRRLAKLGPSVVELLPRSGLGGESLEKSRDAAICNSTELNQVGRGRKGGTSGKIV
jgi:hypothetical protein